MAESWFGGGVGRCPAYWSGQEARRSVPGARVGLDKLPVSSIGERFWVLGRSAVEMVVHLGLGKMGSDSGEHLLQ
jgi:hypothetical protein